MKSAYKNVGESPHHQSSSPIHAAQADQPNHKEQYTLDSCDPCFSSATNNQTVSVSNNPRLE
eukprot:CAMPEP_0194035972 /NCGR_PEP_ID=MMETSP0009_2-20130614/8376_1 /TAXON_ID=210454 /ORGANISM="Grammatophora oceanica, Strain CCMP 410" /LENGTH=61 /DNA_ID=CAMNT_0038677549 /DNA_START=655 /DNA_END=837 /DNA_ORIENTATION=+